MNKGIGMKQNRTQILIDILLLTGGVRPLAKKINISFQAVSKWGRVPVNHVQKISALTGIPAENIRPDIYAKYEPHD